MMPPNDPMNPESAMPSAQSVFDRMRLEMEPSEIEELLNPPGDAPDQMGTFPEAGGDAHPPASALPSASSGDQTLSMEPEMVREDLRELLRRNANLRKEMRERFVDENLSMNRGNL